MHGFFWHGSFFWTRGEAAGVAAGAAPVAGEVRDEVAAGSAVETGAVEAVKLESVLSTATAAAATVTTDARAEFEAAVWPSGSYWQPCMQPPDQLDKVEEGWCRHYAALGGDAFFLGEGKEGNAGNEARGGGDLPTLGARLQKVARRVAAEAHPFGTSSGSANEEGNTETDVDVGAYRQYRTLIHGDPKAANLFVRPKVRSTRRAAAATSTPGTAGAPTAAGNPGALPEATAFEAALIDFQWSGFGLAATDVAHHICAGVSGEALVGDGGDVTAVEEVLLNHYYSALCSSLHAYGAAASVVEARERVFPRHVFQEQYERAVLDTARLVFAYQWTRLGICPDVLQRNASSLNRAAYNKSAASAQWLVRRVDALLSKDTDGHHL
jgi:hypothetical protein